MGHRKDIPPNIETGTYRNHKGDFYEVTGVGRHTEVEDCWFVIYHKLGSIINELRPYDMFVEYVDKDGQSVPRFERVPEQLEGAMEGRES